MENTKLISELLLHCEEKGLAPKYVYDRKTYEEQGSSFFRQSLPVRTDPVEYNCKGEEIFVVSETSREYTKERRIFSPTSLSAAS